MLVAFPNEWRRFGILALSAVLVAFVMLTIKAQTAAHKPRGEHVLTFDAPGAGADAGQGTVPRGINSNGEITGEYYDEYSAVHGFLRKADGSIKTFDVPGASKADGQGTFSESVNAIGEVAGFYYDRSSKAVYTRGFTRDAKGVITTFDAGPRFGTIPVSIDSRGEVTGAYSNEGFVRVNGVVRAFAVSKFVTVPKSINSRGEITGWYKDGSSGVHGFVRSASGEITSFDAGPRMFTTPVAINSSGEITGYCNSASSGIHGFVRSPKGTIDTFDVEPDSNTIPYGINEKGEITGAWYHANSQVHGFVLEPDGAITKFDVQGAANPYFGDGTTPQGVNAKGEITGWYTDAHGVYHGFVRVAASGISSR
jgi:hypothetical protein